MVASVWVCGSRGGGDGVDGRREQSVGGDENWNLLGVVLSTKYNLRFRTTRSAIGPLRWPVTGSLRVSLAAPAVLASPLTEMAVCGFDANSAASLAP